MEAAGLERSWMGGAWLDVSKYWAQMDSKKDANEIVMSIVNEEY